MDFVSEAVNVLLEHWVSSGLLAIGLYYFFNRERRNVPPGPIGLPVVGYIPFLSDTFPHHDLLKLSKKYGSVFSLKLGPNNVIIINDFASAAEALNHEHLQDRPEHNLFNMFAQGGMTAWSGQLWKEHRRFTLRALRALGVGKQEIENLVIDEISFLLSQIETSSDGGKSAIAIRELLAPSASNVVHSVVLGKRLDYEDPIRKLLTTVFANFNEKPLPLTGYFIQFAKIIGSLLRWFLSHQYFVNDQTNAFAKNILILHEYIDGEIAKRKGEFDANNPKDYVDLYMAECRENNAYFDEKYVGLLALDLFGAGSSTTKDALEWILLYLAKYQDVQEKVFKEISDIIGFDRKPIYADKNLMPYLQAVIMESQRKATMLPINLAHSASEDAKLGDYVITKGSQILVNMWALHNDPAYWKEPERFDPTRFLDAEGTKLVKRESFIPFGYGRRACPGESLAQVELFAFIVSIVQKFKVTPAEGTNLSDAHAMTGFGHVPRDLNLLFSPRTVL